MNPPRDGERFRREELWARDLAVVGSLNEIESGELTATRIVDPIINRTLLLATAKQRSAGRATREVAQLIRLQVSELVRQKRWSFEGRKERPTAECAATQPLCHEPPFLKG
jgi:hypothetical protein